MYLTRIARRSTETALAPLRMGILLAIGQVVAGCANAPSPETASEHASGAAAPLAGKTQLVTVVTDDWNRFQATLRRYERIPEDPRRWVQTGRSIDVVLGRQGYGWGRGLHGDGAPRGRPGPIKQEGDGRSPAGVFALGKVYGYAPSARDLSLPYEQATDGLRCVDDPKSAKYNRIVSVTDTNVDWRSAERMRRDDDLYTLAIVIEHNTENTLAGAGSCIFVHLWKGPDQGMSGCTALPKTALEELARWLEPGATAWVALPRAEYEALRGPWGLPAVNPFSRP